MQPTGTSYAGLTFRTAPTNSSNTSQIKLLLDTNNTDSQTQSSLFSRIPGEIRNHIFDLALTAYPGKQEPFEKSAYYCRPGFRYADMKIDTALLLTCRRAYGEARLVPQQNYEHVQWIEGGYAPSVPDARKYSRCPIDSRDRDIYPWVTSLHLFIAQSYLEDASWRIYVRGTALKDLRSLKITIRHCEWNSFETHYPIGLDAKQTSVALASPRRHSTATDEFEKKSWGRQFVVFEGLKKLELELETVEETREELDEIVTRAADWRFPLGRKNVYGNVFVMNPARTKKTGWHGVRNLTARYSHVRRDPKEAKARLVKDGIEFIAWDGEPEILDDNCLTYYVVSLIYEAQPASAAA